MTGAVKLSEVKTTYTDLIKGAVLVPEFYRVLVAKRTCRACNKYVPDTVTGNPWMGHVGLCRSNGVYNTSPLVSNKVAQRAELDHVHHPFLYAEPVVSYQSSRCAIRVVYRHFTFILAHQPYIS